MYPCVGFPVKTAHAVNGCAPARPGRTAANPRPRSRNLTTRLVPTTALIPILLWWLETSIAAPQYYIALGDFTRRGSVSPPWLGEGAGKTLPPGRGGSAGPGVEGEVRLQRFERQPVGGARHDPHAAAAQVARETAVGEEDLEARHL